MDRAWAHQSAQPRALHYAACVPCHSMRTATCMCVCVCCRDIKPENILFTADMKLKLCDFGLAINMRDERAVTRAGTLVKDTHMHTNTHTYTYTNTCILTQTWIDRCIPR